MACGYRDVRLAKVLSKRANSKVPLLFLADTNMTIGEVVSTAFGHFAAEKPSPTLEEFARARELHPDDPGAHSNYGAALRSVGRYSDLSRTLNGP